MKEQLSAKKHNWVRKNVFCNKKNNELHHLRIKCHAALKKRNSKFSLF